MLLVPFPSAKERLVDVYTRREQWSDVEALLDRELAGAAGAAWRPGCRAGHWEGRPLPGPAAREWSLIVWRAEAAERAPAGRSWNLTPRQREVLALIARGLSNAGIAESPASALGTVEFHVSALFDKVGVNSRAALLATVMKK